MMVNEPSCPELKIYEMDEESRRLLFEAIVDWLKAGRERAQGDDGVEGDGDHDGDGRRNDFNQR